MPPPEKWSLLPRDAVTLQFVYVGFRFAYLMSLVRFNTSLSCSITMSNTTVEVHATLLSTIVACASAEVGGNQAESVPSSPTTAPPNSSPPSSDSSASGEDTDIEVVVTSNILTTIEAGMFECPRYYLFY